MLNICFNGGERTLLELSLPGEEFIHSYEDLDLGHIHPNNFNIAREEWINKTYASYSESEKKHMLNEAHLRHNYIIETAKNTKKLCIWCASNPASQCGLFYTIHTLKGIDCKIFVVDMPSDIGCLPPTHDRSWGEAEPAEIEPCLQMQREMSEAERQIYEQIWEILIKENAELRININGRITSVPVDYFDEYILSTAPSHIDFKLGTLVGYALQCSHYLNPNFVEYRIERMISDGMITLVQRSTDPDFNNATILRKNHH